VIDQMLLRCIVLSTGNSACRIFTRTIA